MAPPVFTKTNIFNQVLFSLGEESVGAPTDADKRARVINELYDMIVEKCLAKRNWRFATKKAALTVSGTKTPAGRWKSAYPLPADFVRMLFIFPGVRYEIQEEEFLFCNETSDIVIDYIYYEDDGENTWPAWFVNYVVTELVVRTCRGITGNSPDADQKDERDDALIEAETQDSQQQPNQEALPNPFISCRD